MIQHLPRPQSLAVRLKACVFIGLAVHALIYILLIFKFDLYRGACGGGRFNISLMSDLQPKDTISSAADMAGIPLRIAVKPNPAFGRVTVFIHMA